MNLTKFITEVGCSVCGKKLHLGQIHRTGPGPETFTFKPIPKFEWPDCGSGRRLVERRKGFLRVILLVGVTTAFFAGSSLLLAICGYPGSGVFGFVLAFVSMLLIVLVMFNFNVLLTNWLYREEVVE